ncbi:cell growth regulator with RING finger domain protein 1-like isoform X1 [Argopecten irradians]
MNLNSTSVQQVNLAVEQCVTDMVNPFSVKLRPGVSSSLKDGLHIQLSLLKKCILQVYWGIDLEEFHKAIQTPWQQILNHLQAKSWLDGYTLFCNENKELNPCDSRHEHIQCPEEMSSDALGEPPRKKYPAMVVTFLPGLEDEDYSLNPKIVAVFSVIHLKDDVCSQDSHILNQYMKTSNQRVFTLQPLFISTSPDSRTSSQPVNQSSETIPSPHSSSQGDQLGETQNPESSETEDRVHSTKDGNLPDICKNYREANVGTDLSFPKESVNDGHIHGRGACRSEYQDNLLTQSDHQSQDFRNSEQEEECIVCQTELVAFALLPCRHTCVCQSCFRQLDRCPMCRGYIESYFRVRHGSDSESMVTEEETQDTQVPTLHGSMWERLNSRLNTFFGFS